MGLRKSGVPAGSIDRKRQLGDSNVGLLGGRDTSCIPPLCLSLEGRRRKISSEGIIGISYFVNLRYRWDDSSDTDSHVIRTDGVDDEDVEAYVLVLLDARW